MTRHPITTSDSRRVKPARSTDELMERYAVNRIHHKGALVGFATAVGIDWWEYRSGFRDAVGYYWLHHENR